MKRTLINNLIWPSLPPQLATCRRWGLRCRNRTSQIIIYLVPLSRWHKTTWTRTVVRSKSVKLYNHNQATGFDDYMIMYIYICDRSSSCFQSTGATPNNSLPQHPRAIFSKSGNTSLGVLCHFWRSSWVGNMKTVWSVLMEMFQQNPPALCNSLVPSIACHISMGACNYYRSGPRCQISEWNIWMTLECWCLSCLICRQVQYPKSLSHDGYMFYIFHPSHAARLSHASICAKLRHLSLSGCRLDTVDHLRTAALPW